MYSKHQEQLLSLKAQCPMHTHLSESPTESIRKVRCLINRLDNSYVIMTNEARNKDTVVSMLGKPYIDTIFLESALSLKYKSKTLPSTTNLIVWNYWSISFPLLSELLQKPWGRVDVFASYFDWEGQV